MITRKWCVILLVLIVAPIFVFGGHGDDPFPIKPGSEEWNKLTSNVQRVEMLQLPKNELEKMPTTQLLQVCLDYPLAPEMMLYDTIQQGTEIIIGQFNGLQELMKRKDAAIILLKFYSKLSPDLLDRKWTLRRKGEFAFKFRYIELLLSQDCVLSTLSSSKRRQLLRKAIQTFESKRENPEVYGLMSLNAPVLVMARVLEKDNSQALKRQIGENERLNQFLKTAHLIDSDLMDPLVAEANDYLSNYRIGE